MAYYRIYGFGYAPMIQDVAEAMCECDEDVVAAAHRLLDRFPKVEIWELSRKVATLQRAAPPDNMPADERV
jgi:hypothetical protein